MEDEKKESLKILYKEVGARSVLLEGLNKVSDNLFGGRQDQALMKVCKRIHDGVKEYSDLRNNAYKKYGHLDTDLGPGAYSVKGLPMDKLEELNKYLADLEDVEIDLKITEPIVLKKRRSHTFTAMDAAVVMDFITVEYDENDEGKWLDEEKKK